jgi:predicted aldo/keto reductase-like oxidoreductase
MKYRTFGKLSWRPSALGFGAMRLPVIDGDPAKIDEPVATQMIRYAVDHGVNYVDTAYPYHRGQSEPFLARALRDGYREKVKLATKLPSWLVKSVDDLDRYLGEQLERLQEDSIDFYLLHSMNKGSWANLRGVGVLDWAERAMADGRFQHLGFSFHDEYEVFQEIVDGYDNWTFCQIQYNYMDVDEQAGTRGLRYAADRGLAVVIMEPLRGGQLAKEPPEAVAQLWAGAPSQRTPADWALQWLWNQPEVSVVLSGMSAMQHVVENVASADRSGVDTLTADELALVERVREAYRGLSPIPCTNCKYCLPCPNGVEIPQVFDIYNKATVYDDLRRGRWAYRENLEEGQRADACVACNQCEELCPQSIPIAEWLEKAHALLSGEA